MQQYYTSLKFTSLPKKRQLNRQLKVVHAAPQWASRTRRFTLTENFTPKRTRKFPCSTTASCTATECSRGFVFIMGVFFGLANIWIVCGIRLAPSALKFQ